MPGERIRRFPLLVLPLFLLCYGYGTIDVADFYRLSAAPFDLNTDPGRQFLQSSPLPYILGFPVTRTLGPTVSFLIVIGGGLLLFAGALYRFAATRYPNYRNDALLMLLATPLWIVMTQYIGKSDPFIIAFALLLASASHPLVQVASACLVVLSHFEIGLLMLASAIFLRVVPLRTAMTGATIGAVLVLAYLYFVLPSPPQSRTDVGMLLLRESLAAVAATPILHLIFTFGPFWLCVVAAWPLDWKWIVACGATAVLASATVDFTRVFTLVGLPLAIAVIDRVMAARAAAGDAARPPAWVSALPILVFFQAHLIGQYVYDSRVPELLSRLLDYDLRR
ncbi:MAG TPA: hypothetical protein VEA16_15680 [Vicinamibacterales bacterium]|nr:hypothetical protein [Vicinamibacterales bacterium]